jgi:hypothetical protein
MEGSQRPEARLHTEDPDHLAMTCGDPAKREKLPDSATLP